MGGAARTSGVPGSSADAVAPVIGQGPTATLPGPSGWAREGLGSRGTTGRVASSLMLRSPVGRSAIEIGWFVMLVPGWFGGKRTPPILRAPKAPCLESTDFALSQSGSASDSNRRFHSVLPAPRWAPQAPGALVGGGPVSWARARGGLIAGSESGAGGENVQVRDGQHAGSASLWLAVARLAAQTAGVTLAWGAR
jgi:hypothetical protein